STSVTGMTTRCTRTGPLPDSNRCSVGEIYADADQLRHARRQRHRPEKMSPTRLQPLVSYINDTPWTGSRYPAITRPTSTGPRTLVVAATDLPLASALPSVRVAGRRVLDGLARVEKAA